MIIRGVRMLPVESSAIKSIGYDGYGSLYVEYVSGSVYEYKDVSVEEFIKLLNTDSIGKFVNTYIKDHNYDYIR